MTELEKQFDYNSSDVETQEIIRQKETAIKTTFRLVKKFRRQEIK